MLKIHTRKKIEENIWDTYTYIYIYRFDILTEIYKLAWR